jgi:serine/threonine-protein kinase RsbW
LTAKLNSITTRKIHPLEQESDRGLFFMKQLTDELHYIRAEDERNCLLMVKKNILFH